VAYDMLSYTTTRLLQIVFNIISPVFQPFLALIAKGVLSNEQTHTHTKRLNYFTYLYDSNWIEFIQIQYRYIKRVAQNNSLIIVTSRYHHDVTLYTM